MNPKNISIEDYNYDLPENRIAKFPLKQRDTSKLLVYNNHKIYETQFKKLTEIVDQSYTMVFNDTKVIQARLLFRKATGAKIEIFCLEPFLPADFEQNFAQTKSCQWKCIVGNAKKWKNDILIKTLSYNDKEVTLKARKIKNTNDGYLIEFDWNMALTFAEIIDIAGVMPIPPYLNRESVESDRYTYQTVYSQHKGSVAAPTAGLHFTTQLINKLTDKNIKTEKITLHVGAGTFKPVKTDKVGEHEMHNEHFFIKKDTIKNLLQNKNRILTVGTTTVRTVESLYWLGVKLIKGLNINDFHISQWEIYDIDDKNIDRYEAINAVYEFLKKNNRDFISASTQIIIVPGYEFKMTDALITNFHQPKSTLLLLIAAFVGEDWKKIYDYALNNDFRFLSYGDSSLLIPKNNN